MTRSLMVYGVGLMMLLSTGGNLLVETETESPVKESQGEKEGEAKEVFVRHAKPRKIRLCFVTTHPVTTPPSCCYQHIRFIRGHQLENGLVAPLLC